MKRLPAIILFLLLGAALNIAVAWACAMYGSDDGPDVDVAPRSDWGEHLGQPWPGSPDPKWFERSSIGLTSTDAYGWHTVDGDEELAVLWMFSTGLPLRSMKLERTDESYGSFSLPLELLQPETWREGLAPPAILRPNSYRFLPTIPLWPGFLINTLLYTTILYSVTLAPTLRRTLRHRRGLCPRCAYDLRALPPTSTCPECGAPPRGPKDHKAIDVGRARPPSAAHGHATNKPDPERVEGAHELSQ